ncbi:MAG: hypothetical protein ABFD80_05990, partial [Acidobacteriota bacterium]
MKRTISIVACWAVAFALAGCAPAKRQPAAPAGESFYTPAEPPSSRYVIVARVDVAAAAVEGREAIFLKNTGRAPIGTVALDWTTGPSS